MPAIKQMKELEIQFHKDMLSIYENARKIGYNATRFRQMVANEGGYNVAKKFINNNKPSEGFTSLWELGRLDLTVESLVLHEEYNSLFNEFERSIVRDRLEEYGFESMPHEELDETEETMIEHKNTWIFQGNPRVFDIDNYVSNHQYIWWSLRQEHFRNQVQINDDVYLWRSDGDNRGTGGILAKARVVSLPTEHTDDTSSDDYWHVEDESNSYLGIKLEVKEVRKTDGFISRLSLHKNDVLKDLLILRLRQQTNYLLPEEHVKEIDRLWQLNSAVANSLKTLSLQNSENSLPNLEPSNRSREFDIYEADLRAEIVYEYLFNSQSHRWLDEHVLGIALDKRTGHESMNVLHYIGLKNTHKGLFEGFELEEAMSILRQQNDYRLVMECLEHFNILRTRKSNLIDYIKSDIDSELFEEDEYHKDGATTYYYGKRYERNPKNRAKAIEIHGLNCNGCGFNFEKVYGERGKDFIEIHHVKPLSTNEEEVTINPETDLIPVCSNCHRMIHRKKNEILTIKELRELI